MSRPISTSTRATTWLRRTLPGSNAQLVALLATLFGTLCRAMQSVRRGAMTTTGPIPTAVDRTVAAAFLAVMVVERTDAASRIGARMPLAILLSVAIAGPIAVRRSAPLAAYVVGSAALSVEALFVLPSPLSPYANLIGLYSLGLHGTRGRARLGPVVVLLGMVAYFSGSAHTYPVIPAGALFVWLLSWSLGYGAARRQEERETARRLLRHQAVAEERARIARELHDLVGHTLNVMLVQAGAARRLLGRDPEQSRELLTGMEHTGREALDELDRVLGLLRHGSPTHPSETVTSPLRPAAAGAAAPATTGTAPAPSPTQSPTPAPPPAPAPTQAHAPPNAPLDEPNMQPGLSELSRLTARMEQAGIRVTARIDPAVRQVPRSIDMSAYRIVQEALTNTLKHGQAESAEVIVRRDGRVIDIEVRDDGSGAVGGYTPGRGLLGIAERASMFGGSVEHEGGERGGFRLHAVLPIP
ncbi:sensor histidine kinase [Kitasatospora mediocidica]|uniref:sensor histidine kinase n=1 Tax=Kitasatospora mediocidica TaxID=58352 RepID=UPI0005687F52|nr:histidine kinase [Kitasatospora mediocidica]